MSAALMEARRLGYRFPAGRWALRGIDLRIRAGDRLALLGANGAGKSTLLLALAGVLPLSEGRLLWEAEAVETGKSRCRLRDRVGVLLQDPEDQLFAPTVEQDVAFGLAQRGMPDAVALDRARFVLDSLLIRRLAERPIHHLSLGEKKRVALAGLIALRPALLLLDEPTAGLDQEGTRALLDVLGRLQAEGAAVVLTTHDAGLAAQWANHVAILDAGRITARGDTQSILADRAALAGARLTPPATYVAAMALRELYPPAAKWPLPATPEALERFIGRIAQAQATGAPESR